MSNLFFFPLSFPFPFPYFNYSRSYQEYEDIAVDLATNQEKYGQIRRELQEFREESPLFDTQLWVRHYERGIEVGILIL